VTALWSVAPGRMALRQAPLPLPSGEHATFSAICSGVSRGTEALVLQGGVPPSEHERMRCPHQEGDFPHPVKYGYAMVARITDGPSDRVGEVCFLLHPHQDRFTAPLAAAVPLPNGLPQRRAALCANMETALNILWDAGVAPGDRVLVVGGGVVGLLTAALAARVPGTDVTLTDLRPERGDLAARLGAGFAPPDSLPADLDVAINTSGASAGLQTAIDVAGPEAIVVEASWHGDRQVALTLGGAFHARRLTIRSSQVGAVPPARARRWNFHRRLSKAALLLAGMPEADVLISHDIAFSEAPERLPPLLSPGGDALCVLLTYP